VRYLVRECNDKRYALEKIIGEDAEGRIYVDTIGYSNNRQSIDDLAASLNTQA
jgi:hypothetical protein